MRPLLRQERELERRPVTMGTVARTLRTDPKGQLLLLTGIIFTITMLIIASATVRFAVVRHQTIPENHANLAVEYDNIKQSFAASINPAVNNEYRGGTDRHQAIKDGIRSMSTKLARVEAQHGLNFQASIEGSISQLDTTHFQVPIRFTLTDSTTTITEMVSYQVELALEVDIAIFSPLKGGGWLQDETVGREAGYLELNLAARSVTRYNYYQQDTLCNWLEANTEDGEMDVLIIFDWAPHAAYPTSEGSLLEMYLDDGNMIICTGDWAFYYTIQPDGSVVPRYSSGFQQLLDISNANAITAVASETNFIRTSSGDLLPSLPDTYTSERPVNANNLDSNWQVAAEFSTQEGTMNKDALAIHNTETDGYYAQFFMNRVQTHPRGAVIEEFIENWVLAITG